MAGGPHPQNGNTNSPAAAANEPCTAATAAKLVARLGLTEGEAQAMLAAREVTAEEVHDAQKVDVHALAAAFTPEVVEALGADQKVELTDADKADTGDRAGRVRIISSACDKLTARHDFALASVKLDGSVLQSRLNDLVPQIKARLKANPGLQTTYSSLLSYQHARYPGRNRKHASPKDAAGEEKDSAAK